MIERKMSLTPRGNLADRLKEIFVGTGTEIKISGKYYTLRESGISEGDKIGECMLAGLKEEAMKGSVGYLGFTCVLHEFTGEEHMKRNAEKDYDYSIRFVREKISPKPAGSKARYVIVKSEPYRVFQSSGNPISTYELGLYLDSGKSLINAIFEGSVKNSGKPPAGVELSIGKNLFESITLNEEDL